MRYFISFYDTESFAPMGAGVVDANSTEEAMDLVKNLPGFPGTSDTTEAMLFELTDEDEQGKRMLGKFLSPAQMIEEARGTKSYLDDLPKEMLPIAAELMARMLENPESKDGRIGGSKFVGAAGPDGNKKSNIAVVDEIRYRLAKLTGSVH